MKIKSTVFVGILSLTMIACSPKYYSPNTQNVPLITEKGETNLTLSGNGNQIEIQGAYGISQSIALKANGGLFIPKDLKNGNGGSGKYLEIGGGYYKALSNNLVFETYGLIGFGNFENHLPSTTSTNPQTKGDISASLFRIGIQPNFGYKSKYFSAALSSRFVNLSYSSIEGDLIFENENQAEYLDNNASNFLIEPAVTIRGGLEKVQLQFQAGVSMNVSNNNFRQDKSFLTLGLNFNFR